MRKFAIIGMAISVFFLATRPVTAQQNMAGLKGGLVSANVSVDVDMGPSPETEARTGLGGGAFLQVRAGEHLSIQPEVLFVPKGFKTPFDDVEATVKTNYIQVPILVQYHVPTSGTVSPRLFAGPAVAFQGSCDVEGVIDGTTVEATCEEADVVATKDTDFGLVFGAGVDIAAGPVILTLDGRYDVGFTDLLEEGGAEVRTRALEFFAGVGIPVGP